MGLEFINFIEFSFLIELYPHSAFFDNFFFDGYDETIFR